MYAGLQATKQFTVRALVHSNASEAAATLHCKACDASEGIYYGDVTNVTTLIAAFSGASAVVSAVGVSGEVPEAIEAAVEWRGVENQVAALANQSTSLPASQLKFVIVSSMGKAPPQSTPTQPLVECVLRSSFVFVYSNSGMSCV